MWPYPSQEGLLFQYLSELDFVHLNLNQFIYCAHSLSENVAQFEHIIVPWTRLYLLLTEQLHMCIPGEIQSSALYFPLIFDITKMIQVREQKETSLQK